MTTLIRLLAAGGLIVLMTSTTMYLINAPAWASLEYLLALVTAGVSAQILNGLLGE